MAGLYGDFAAKYVVQGAVNVITSAWTPLRVGSTNLEDRRHVRIFVRGKIGSAVALAYANKNEDGTFTTPTTATADIRLTTVLPGNSLYTEPLSDKVTVYGKLLDKVANTDSSVRVIITEYK